MTKNDIISQILLMEKLGLDISELVKTNDVEKLNGIKGALDKLNNAKLFLSYIKSQGFNPNNYEQVLELNQDVLGSISLYLREYQQFLLSTKVVYDELHQANIYGGRGYVEKDGLFVPKSLDADDHFFGGYLPKVPYKRYLYAYPKINEDECEYDATVSNGISEEDKFDLIVQSRMDLFLGDILDTNSPEYEGTKTVLLNRLNNIKNNSIWGVNTQISIDHDSKNNKVFLLLSRRK